MPKSRRQNFSKERPSPSRPTDRGQRIVRVPVFHEGTFRAIVRAAATARRCIRYHGDYWEPLSTGRQSAMYRRSQHDLAWIQQRVADYEFFLYRRLLSTYCARDGNLRPHAKLRRGGGGAYRPSAQAAGGD